MVEKRIRERERVIKMLKAIGVYTEEHEERDRTMIDIQTDIHIGVEKMKMQRLLEAVMAWANEVGISEEDLKNAKANRLF